MTLSSKPGDLFLVGSGLIEGLEKTLEVEITKLVEFDGEFESFCNGVAVLKQKDSTILWFPFTQLSDRLAIVSGPYC